MIIKKRIPGIVIIVVIISITGLLLSSCAPFQSFHNKDGWNAVIQSVKDGTYKEKYSIGDTLELDLGSEGIVEMQIVAFDADELADGNGKAAITWISKQLLNSDHRMNPAREDDPSDSSKYLIGTGSIGGWANSEMRSWLQSDVKALIPSTVRNAIKPVRKYSTSYTTANPSSSESYIYNESTVDDVWIPSWQEVYGSDSGYSGWYERYESSGPTYALFDSYDDRVKQKTGASRAPLWWLRSASSGNDDFNSYHFERVLSGGGNDASYADAPCAVALGFCI